MTAGVSFRATAATRVLQGTIFAGEATGGATMSEPFHAVVRTATMVEEWQRQVVDGMSKAAVVLAIAVVVGAFIGELGMYVYMRYWKRPTLLETFWEWDAQSIRRFAGRAGIPVVLHKSEIRRCITHVLARGADTRLATTTHEVGLRIGNLGVRILCLGIWCALDCGVYFRRRSRGTSRDADPGASLGNFGGSPGGLIVRRRERSAVTTTCG
jgi:hypothetical protein